MDKLRVALDKIKCKACSKRVEVLEVAGGGEKIKYAPCKCGCENIISSEKWNRGPAEVDLIDEEEIIQHIRDLLNLADLLENGFDSELLIFIRQLRRAGYPDDRIHKFITSAGYGTRFGGCGRKGTESGVEYELGCGRDVPRVLPKRGDYKEWLRLKPRAM